MIIFNLNIVVFGHIGPKTHFLDCNGGHGSGAETSANLIMKHWQPEKNYIFLLPQKNYGSSSSNVKHDTFVN